MPQLADFGRFYHNLASNMLAYHAATAAICQQFPQPLLEVPTLASELDAESWQNPPDLENLFLHRWMRYFTDCSFEGGDFLVEKRARGL
jgi:hypothetical protein